VPLTPELIAGAFVSATGTVTLPTRVPAAVGLNDTFTTHEDAAGILPAHVVETRR
jgi:hypothetical protein